jgi:hypothetical protein
MFNLSDRDAKIIMLLLIVAVVALPYVFYTKDTREDIEVQKAKNVQLEERYNQLLEMNKYRDWYIKETERLDNARNELIYSFPADVRSENYTMFLLNMEYNSQLLALDNMLKIEEDEELQRPGMTGIDGNTTIYIDSVAYGANDIIPISEEGASETLQGIVNTSVLTYFCYYDGMKYLTKYLNGYYEETKDDAMPDREPMIFKSLDMSFDPETGVIKGSITMQQYAISGLGRELPAAEIWPDLDEYENRGNVEDGIFGPLDPEVIQSRIEWLGTEEEEEEAQTAE